MISSLQKHAQRILDMQKIKNFQVNFFFYVFLFLLKTLIVNVGVTGSDEYPQSLF